MATFKTKHYTFEFDRAMVQSVKITNRDGKSFFVMAKELRDFMTAVELETKLEQAQAAVLAHAVKTGGGL